MKHPATRKLACLALIGGLAQGLLACSDDNDRPPPIGAPTGHGVMLVRVSPVTSAGGSSSRPIASNGGALGGAESGVFPNVAGDFALPGFGGDGVVAPDPFGVGGGTSSDPFGSGGSFAVAGAVF